MTRNLPSHLKLSYLKQQKNVRNLLDNLMSLVAKEDQFTMFSLFWNRHKVGSQFEIDLRLSGKGAYIIVGSCLYILSLEAFFLWKVKSQYTMTLASYFQKEESECFASYDKNKKM